jgi:hypothetical protein
MITLNGQAPGICHAPAGLKVKIKFITKSIGGGYTIGIYSHNKKISEWGDLDGEVGSRRGWWIGAGDLAHCLEDTSGDFVVDKPLKHLGTDLTGKKCRILAQFDNGSVFVEFDEDIAGCSADGLGKAGHCVAVSPGILAQKRRKKHAK